MPSAMDYITKVIAANNIAGDIEETVLEEMAQQLVEDHQTDKGTMTEWFTKMEAGIKFARLVKEDKTYPHDKAANIKFPLITSAALHYNARTYPAIAPSGNPVLTKVHGEDPDGKKAARGERTADYTSHQLRNEIVAWEEDTDRLTFIGPIVGTMLKKVWFDPAVDEPRSKLCVAGKVIINHNITHISEAPAITEEFELRYHEIESRIRSNVWGDVRDKLNLQDDEKSKPVEFLEQHMRFDLDDDGYDEPYIVTLHVDSQTVVRVVANFALEDVMLADDGSIITVKPSTYFVPYTFLPAFDGGFWGDGLGMLLGDMSETINSMLNMIMDSGHYQSLPSGWIAGKDLRIKPGNNRMVPGEFRTVNATGGDLRGAIVQAQMPEPSNVLFQMLGLLIDMGRDISSSKDITPEQGAQMTATTTMALVDQGERVFNASYKRMYRALSAEFKLLFKLNKNVNPEKYNAFFDDEEQHDPKADFDASGMDVTPIADPKAVTNTQKAAKAQFLMEMAQAGMLDPAAAMTRVLEVMAIEDVEELIPQQSPQDQMIQELQMVDAQLDLKLKAAKIDLDMANTIKAIADAEAAEDGQQLQQYADALTVMKQEIEVAQQRAQPMGQQAAQPAGQPAQQ